MSGGGLQPTGGPGCGVPLTASETMLMRSAPPIQIAATTNSEMNMTLDNRR